MDVVARVAWDRLGLWAAPQSPATPTRAGVALATLARAGIRVANPGALTDHAVTTIGEVITHERERRGQRGVYTPLFAGFPDELPYVDNAYLRALIGAARLAGVDDPGDEQVRAAFDFTDLGWWPASSVPQDVPAALAARARQAALPADGSVQWTTVHVVDPAEATDRVRAWMADAFASPTSLRADVREDLVALVEVLGVEHIDVNTVRFRETRTLLARLVWDRNLAGVPALGLSPDDVLRLFADLTDGDVSLARPVRYPHLTHAQRRVVVRTLEGSDRLTDVFRRRGLWLAIGRGLHVGAQRGAPRTREVFERLRATRHDHSSTASQLEAALKVDLPLAYKIAAQGAPGVLGRQLRRLASLAGDDPVALDALVDALQEAGGRVPLRVLLTARAQIADNGATYPRVAITVKGTALTIDRPVGHLAVTEPVRARLLAVLGALIATQIAAKGTWEGQLVWVEPGLERVLVPDGLRTTLPGLVQVERGSALPIGDAPVVRLFVHWKHPHSDLDLSCLALGEDFEVRDHVSYTHLRSGAMVHSGDITSAPAGAQEFIDIDLAAARDLARERGWRYLAPAIFRYSGPSFSELDESVAGWMLRTKTGRDRVVFDVATVAGAFEVRGRGRTALPFVLDVLTGEIVYVDLYLHGGAYARVEREGAAVGSLVRALVERRHLRTDVASLVLEHVATRGGQMVDDRSRATITVGTGGACTYDALRPEKLLADLL